MQHASSVAAAHSAENTSSAPISPRRTGEADQMHSDHRHTLLILARPSLWQLVPVEQAACPLYLEVAAHSKLQPCAVFAGLIHAVAVAGPAEPALGQALKHHQGRCERVVGALTLIQALHRSSMIKLTGANAAPRAAKLLKVTP